MAGWSAALPLLNKIADFLKKWWEKRQRKKDYARRQKKRKKIEKDPATAMSEHFNSGSSDDAGVSDASGKSGSNNAAKTDETDAEH